MKLLSEFLVVTLLAGVFADNTKVGSQTEKSVIANIYENLDKIIDQKYDKRIRPYQEDGLPVNVDVSLYILMMSGLSENDMEVTVNFYFRQFWNDPRLSFAHLLPNNTNRAEKPVDYIFLDDDTVKNIWTPDTFFVDDKESFIHKTTKKNSFTKVNTKGEVLKSDRYSVTFECPMDFSRFPFDSPTCSMAIESYALKMNEMKYNWRGEDPANIAPTSLIGFAVTGVRTRNIEIILTTGNYSRLALDIELQRSFGYYIYQVYMPCIMLVILSYISFYVKTLSVRLTTCTLALLLSVIGCIHIADMVPKSSYIKSIDLFTGTCMLFIQVAFVVFAYVSNKHSEKSEFPTKIDTICKVVYPICFVAFMLLYTIFCCH